MKKLDEHARVSRTLLRHGFKLVMTVTGSVARWSRLKPILVIFFNGTSPLRVFKNLVPRIVRKMGSCRLVCEIIANVLRLITPFYYLHLLLLV